MITLWLRLTRATRLLALLTLGLVALNGWALLSYRPWARLPLRLTYADAHGYPVYSDSTAFLRNGQRLTEFDYSFRGLTDSTQHSPLPHLLGTWVPDVGVDGRVLPLPTQLRVDYTSLAEGRSYRGTFPLPASVLDSLLAEARRQPGRYRSLFTPGEEPGLELQAALAPGGVVLVRLLGENYATEVARFQARPYPTRWPKLAGYPDSVPYRSLPALRRLMSRAEQAHLDSFPRVPLGRWDTLRARYPYRLRVLAPLRPQSLHVRYLNEDEETLPGGGQSACRPQPLPDFVRYVVQDARFRQPRQTVCFDPVELRRALALLPPPPPGECLDLLVQPTPGKVWVLLKYGHQQMELTRSIIYAGPE